MRFLKGLLKVLLTIFIVLLIAAIFLLTPVNREPLTEQDYYKETIENLSTLKLEESEGTFWSAGWASENITPEEPVELVGFRPRGEYEFVLDSSFVKSIIVSNGQQKVAFLAYPFMIIHPYLSKEILATIQSEKLSIDHFYFTASHTHSGFGGHMKGLLSDIMYGGFDSATVQRIAIKTVLALKNSLAAMDTAQLLYKKSITANLVRNRFIHDDPVDSFVRQLHFIKKSGEKAILFSYSAHATTLSSRFMGLSGDYPHFLEMELEKKDSFQMAMYMAGAVGSHSPIIPDKNENTTENYAIDLYKEVNKNNSHTVEIDSTLMKIAELQVQLGEPQFRVTDNYRFKPWLFDKIIGPSTPKMDIVQLGNLLFISSAAELSGVFYEDWEKLANQNGMELMFTTFNGDYIGYVPPDKYYHKHYRETRELNWYGPYSGEYFDTLTMMAIKKAAND